MARKRMFDLEIINQDSFLDLPMDAKALYFLLGMEADDEGFIAPKKVLRLYGGSEDSLKILILKKFLIPFNTGVVVITDWKRNNYLDKSRVKDTIYQDEKEQLGYDTNKEKYISLTNVPQMFNKYSIEENSIEKISKEKGSIELITHSELKNVDYEKEFEALWKMYPNKKSKKKALGFYITSRKKGSTYEEIENGLYNYLDYIKNEKVDSQYIKHGSTWFNQECWNDEYIIKKKTLKDISIAEIDEAIRLEREQKGECTNDDTIRIY